MPDALKMQPGDSAAVISDLSRADYDALNRISFSRAKQMLRSPAHYHWAMSHPREDTPALRLGRCEHLAILEPDRFARGVDSFAGRRAGARWEEFQASRPGVEILPAADMVRCEAMRAAVRCSSEGAFLLHDGRAEVSVVWEHRLPAIGDAPGYSIGLKARLDCVTRDTIVDLKTCRDASPDGFGRAAWTYRMHVQAAMYVDGYRAATGKTLPYYLIAVETEPPHAVAVYRVTEEQIALGRAEYWEWLDRIQSCMQSRLWPSYGPTRDLELPRWAFPTDEEADVGELDLAVGGR